MIQSPKDLRVQSPKDVRREREALVLEKMEESMTYTFICRYDVFWIVCYLLKHLPSYNSP